MLIVLRTVYIKLSDKLIEVLNALIVLLLNAFGIGLFAYLIGFLHTHESLLDYDAAE